MTVGITFLSSGGGGNLRMLQALIELGVLPGCTLSAVVASVIGEKGLNGPIWTFSVAIGLVALSAIVARFSHRFSSYGTEAHHDTEPPHGTGQEGALK